MSQDLVLVELDDGVATLTINRPERYNAFDVELIRALRRAYKSALADHEVEAIVLTGAGKAFCAGGDVRSMREALIEDPKALFMSLTAELHPLIIGIREGAKPVVAAVNGAVAGGGFGLALACDWRTAAPTAMFKPAYAKLGIVPDGGVTFLLPRIAGWGIANRIIMDDANVSSKDALHWGLVDEIVDADVLLTTARARARKLADLPPKTFAWTKLLLNQSLLSGLPEQLERERKRNADSAAEPALQEGVAAFFEKRSPVFNARAKAMED
jgi:2-(1,2-epoxy-1,2-dihydrophenyl)acetyl-CoA isomerase